MYVDCDLSMRTHGQRTVSRCFAALRQIRRSVPSATLQMLVVALVHSRMDYGNGVLVGLPAYLTRRLQSILNAAARLIYRLRTRDHITDAIISLNWLRVPERIQYKLAVLAYKVLHGDAPRYLGPPTRVDCRRLAWSTNTPFYQRQPHLGFVRDWLTPYLEPYLDNNQFGCRPERSTTHALISVLHKWMETLDNKGSVRAVFVDFRKAFNLVNPNILFRKLQNFNIPNCLLKWLGCYLSQRCQRVRVGSFVSSWKALRGGMPHGSRLGPLSFYRNHRRPCNPLWSR